MGVFAAPLESVGLLNVQAVISRFHTHVRHFTAIRYLYSVRVALPQDTNSQSGGGQRTEVDDIQGIFGRVLKTDNSKGCFFFLPVSKGIPDS